MSCEDCIFAVRKKSFKKMRPDLSKTLKLKRKDKVCTIWFKKINELAECDKYRKEGENECHK